MSEDSPTSHPFVPASPCAEQFPAILSAFRSGDQTARSRLLQWLQEEILAVSGKHMDFELQAKAGVSDVVQSSLLSAATNLEQFAGTTLAEFRAWVRTIVTNEVNGVRRQFHAAKRDVRREKMIDAAPSSILPPDRQLTPSSEAIAQERQQRFHSILGDMTAEHRQVIQLRSLEEKTFKEIAEIMGRSEAAVAQLWYRAILKFEEKLTQSGDFQSGII